VRPLGAVGTRRVDVELTKYTREEGREKTRRRKRIARSRITQRSAEETAGIHRPLEKARDGPGGGVGGGGAVRWLFLAVGSLHCSQCLQVGPITGGVIGIKGNVTVERR